MPRKVFNNGEKTSAQKSLTDAEANIKAVQTTVTSTPAPGTLPDNVIVDLVEARSEIDSALADLGGRPCGGGKPC